MSNLVLKHFFGHGTRCELFQSIFFNLLILLINNTNLIIQRDFYAVLTLNSSILKSVAQNAVTEIVSNLLQKEVCHVFRTSSAFDAADRLLHQLRQ